MWSEVKEGWALLRFKLTSILFLAAAFIICMPYTAFADLTIEAGETYTLSAGETLTIDSNLTIAATGTLDASAGNTKAIAPVPPSCTTGPTSS